MTPTQRRKHLAGTLAVLTREELEEIITDTAHALYGWDLDEDYGRDANICDSVAEALSHFVLCPG